MLLVAYTVVLFLSRWMAYQLRFDFNVPADSWPHFGDYWSAVLCVQLFFLAVSGQFSGIMGYFSLPDVRRLLLASLASTGVLFGIRYQFPEVYIEPRGVILVTGLLGLSGVGAVRLACRLVRERYFSVYAKSAGTTRRVGIVGAGDVGAGLLRELHSRRGLGLEPVVFFDDDRSKWRSQVHGVPVAGSPDAIGRFKSKYNIDEVIIAMPSAPAKRIGEVVRTLRQHKLKFVTVPAIDQLASGKVKVSQLRAVAIEDLLGREPVGLETENIRRDLTGRTVAVTGAGGSIGSELCRQVASFKPKKLLLVEQSEVQLFQIEQELIGLGYGDIIVPLVADILDAARIRTIFAEYRPAVLFHAAAHKHVPMMERQPCEAVKNNALGTARLADLAQEGGLEKFVMISTDKAVNPTSAMGATKRLAELYLQALFARHPQGTKFIAVRFGNVLGSSGSVVPLFTKQIAAGGPVAVTHPDMVRYFMTIPEAAGLVLQSCAQGQGGEIFVLDMGKPVKIADLARQMIELSGLKPDEDIEIKFVGLRPGEKLFEEITCDNEHYRPTHHPRIMSFLGSSAGWDSVQAAFQELGKELDRPDPDRLKRLMQKIVPEYTPFLAQSDTGPTLSKA
ncbi:MAG: polysaccharide biosynthesis protein [Verrucomicrobia bacterium]|nr:polysaccharide biosynthesis protein [Verrucomicrobiota bacterium]